jgi:hypothetical protein
MSNESEILACRAAGHRILMTPTGIVPMAVWVVVWARLSGLVLILLQDSGLGCVLSGHKGAVRHHCLSGGEVVVGHHRLCRDIVVVAIVVAQRVAGDYETFNIAFRVAEIDSSLSFRGVNLGVPIVVTMAVDVGVGVRKGGWLGSGGVEGTVGSIMVDGLITRGFDVVAGMMHFRGIQTVSRVGVCV